MNKAHMTFSRLSIGCFSTLLLLLVACRADFEDLEPATFPTNGDVFIDGFSAGLNYAAFGGSYPSAFDVDTDVVFDGTTSMKFVVPDFEDPRGAYAGGAFFLDSGRDLTGYTALTFWARASQPANLDVIGIGIDLAESPYQASINGLAIGTDWQQFYIPIPDPSKLTQERGMLFYSEGPENNRGYTFWIDEVKFENVTTLGAPEGFVFGGEDRVFSGQGGDVFTADGYSIFSLPNGVDQRVETAPAYFDYTSSDTTIAVVDANGAVMVRDSGTAVITATLAGRPATGSLTVTSAGVGSQPQVAAPTPQVPADQVISLFSDAYPNEPVDFFNGFWEFSTTQSEVVSIIGNDAIRYSQLNFVGIQFTSPTIDISEMTHVRLDIWTPEPTDAPAAFNVLLVDFGPDNGFGGDDDSSFELGVTAPVLQTGQWVTLDLPLSDFPGLTGRSNLAQIVLSGDLPNVYVDNLFFYDDGNGGGGGGGGGDDTPTVAAPTPTRPAASVISLFSDAYDDVPVDTWRTDWSSATLTDTEVAGNAVKRYTALDFVGIETAMSQLDVTGMTHVHVDIWTPDATLFGIKLVDFGPDGAFDGGDDVEQQLDFQNPQQGAWIGYDLPLSDFADLTTRANLAQYIFVAQPSGSATVYLDNFYFYNVNAGSGDTPTVAAPTPTRPAAAVISLFSDAYDDVPVDTWRTDWSSATLTDTEVAGNAVKKYSDLDFVGVETVANQLDITGMTHVHLDVWTPDATLFGIKLVDFGPDGAFDGGDDVEQQLDFASPAQGQWIGYDIPLDDFTNLTTRENLSQYIFVGQPTGDATVFIDNFYFYAE